MRVDCRRCIDFTNHDVLFSHVVNSNPDEYRENDTYSVVRCRGCDSVRFHHLNEDYEIGEFDDSSEFVPFVSLDLYPNKDISSKLIGKIWMIPGLIREVYTQTVYALDGDADILASIGLRACIEAICNHLDVKGRSLEVRINLLHKSGYISTSDKNRLHAIRFMGNDAAHEIVEPKKEDLRVALDILEHILNSLFILERVSKRLEVAITEYSEFKEFISSLVEASEFSESFTMMALLGKRRRRVTGVLVDFEKMLKSDIEMGNFDSLKVVSVSDGVVFYEKVNAGEGADLGIEVISEDGEFDVA